MYVVYKHTTPSGKVYIGITGQKPEKRWRNGEGYKHNDYFYRAILKYGWENIKHEILGNGLTKEQACDLEIELIAEYHATDPRYGYNISAGGEYGSLGVHPSSETRKKMSESRKGKHPSAETRLKLSKANKGTNNPQYGKHPSAETRRKISEATKGSNNPHYGKHHSLEARKKMSEARKGKHLSAETRRKIGESLKGRPHLSHEARKKLTELNKKAVICVETGILYGSVTEAAESIGVVGSAISQVVRGSRKTSGGYHWKYANGGEHEE